MTSPTIDTDPAPRDWEAWARGACARSCSFASCTGRGSTARWAHRCVNVDTDVQLGPCGIEGCSSSAVELVPGGYRCVEHTPPQPPRGPATRLSPGSQPVTYGTANTDPLGRQGMGWHKGKQTKLPTRTVERADPDVVDLESERRIRAQQRIDRE